MKSLALVGRVLLGLLIIWSFALAVAADQSKIWPDWASDGSIGDSSAVVIPASPKSPATEDTGTAAAELKAALLNKEYTPGSFGIDITHTMLTPVDSYLTYIPWRVEPVCTPYGELYKDSSIAMHAHVLEFPDGWPQLFDSSGQANDVHVTPHRFWSAFTPLGTPQAQGPCDENIHIVAGPDGISYSNRVGPDPGDTIANPIFSYEQFHMAPTDTIYWYFDTDYSNGRDDGWPTDTGRYIVDSAGYPGYADTVWQGQICLHLADPDLFADDAGNLWVAFLVVYYPASRIFLARSSDGVHWSEPFPITRLGYWVCPSIVPNGDGTFSLFALHFLNSGFYRQALYRFKSDKMEDIWGSDEVVTFSGGEHNMDSTVATIKDINGDSCLIWHFDVVPFDADQWFIIYSGRRNSMDGNNRWLGAGISHDRGASFEFSQTPLATAPIVPEMVWDSVPYAPSGYFIHNDSEVVFRAYVSSRGPDVSDSWHTGVYDINFYNMNYGIDGVVFLINYIFKSGAAPYPLNRGDVNADCMVNLVDAIYLIDFIFRGGPAPLQGCAE